MTYIGAGAGVGVGAGAEINPASVTAQLHSATQGCGAGFPFWLGFASTPEALDLGEAKRVPHPSNKLAVAAPSRVALLIFVLLSWGSSGIALE